MTAAALPAHVLARPMCSKCGTIRLSKADIGDVCLSCREDPLRASAANYPGPDGMYPCCMCGVNRVTVRGAKCPPCHLEYQRQLRQRKRLRARKMEW